MLSLKGYREELRRKWKEAVRYNEPVVRYANLSKTRPADFEVDGDEWNVDDYNLYDADAYEDDDKYRDNMGRQCIRVEAMLDAIDDLIDNGRCDQAWCDYVEMKNNARVSRV